MSVTSQNLFQSLCDSGVVTAEAIAPFQNRKLKTRKRRTVDALLRELVSADLLTSFQADAVKRGDGESLVVGEYLLLEPFIPRSRKAPDPLISGALYRARKRRCGDPVTLYLQSGDTPMVDSPPVHPHVAGWSEYGESEQAGFWVLGDVTGEDVATVINQYGPLPLEESLQLLRAVALGLAHLEEHGCQPQGLKPQHILLDEQGEPRVLGAACIGRSSNSNTMPAAAISSLHPLLLFLIAGEADKAPAGVPPWLTSFLDRLQDADQGYLNLSDVSLQLGRFVEGDFELLPTRPPEVVATPEPIQQSEPELSPSPSSNGSPVEELPAPVAESPAPADQEQTAQQVESQAPADVADAVTKESPSPPTDTNATDSINQSPTYTGSQIAIAAASGLFILLILVAAILLAVAA